MTEIQKLEYEKYLRSLDSIELMNLRRRMIDNKIFEVQLNNTCFNAKSKLELIDSEMMVRVSENPLER